MALRSRNILSLCAGVGGLELGIMLALAYRGEAGRGICYVEREAAAAASLVASMEAGWFHQAPIWSDLATFDAQPWRGLVHILASGDPCQDNSVAGKRAGADGERFLAPEVVRIARECRPDLIVRENVPGNADGQLAALVPPLARLGYRVAAGIFSSARTGNTMRRERLIVVARAESDGGRAELEPRGARSGWSGFAGEGAGLESAARGTGRLHPRSRRSGDGARDAGGTGEELDRSQRDGWRPGQDHHRSDDGHQSGATGRDMAGSAITRLAIQREPEIRYRSVGHERVAAGEGRNAPLPPAVIPGPTDSRWIAILDRYPELQPALSEEETQSHLRRGIDAMAHRIERLRATGNGVDPVVAAAAILSLGARLDAERA